MRLKHNKKRNTAFLFETLTREYIKAVVKKNTARQTLVKRIIKENFAKGSVLNQELKIYREVLVFGTFVPNYKSLATVYGIFNNKTSIKEKMILEEKMVESLTSAQEGEQQHIDNLTYKTFVEGFNKKYADLPENQKDLLTNYVASFSDNSIELKVYMNEQVSDLKSKLVSHGNDEALQNEQLKEKFEQVLEKLETYKNKEIDDIMVEEVLKIQDLVREFEDA